MKILVSGDWHIDASKIGRINPSTDLDLRIEDFFKAIDFMIDYAVKNNVDLFIMNGDLFKGRTSSHHIETLIAERFSKIAASMKLIINLGNHDYTPKQLAYGIHTYSILDRFKLNNTQLYTEITHLTFDDCDIVLYPYYDLKRVDFESNDLFLKWVEDKVHGFALTKPCKLFVGHGTPKGTIINEDWYFDLDIIDEPVLPHTVFEDFDMVLFSHIHRRHAITKRIFHIGSPERVDFSEADEDKGFVVYDTHLKKMEWVSTNPRPMTSLDITIPDNDFVDPTSEIIQNLKDLPNFDQRMLKITINCSSQTSARIDRTQLKGELDKAFYCKPINFIIPRVQKSRIKEVTEHLSVVEALEKVLAQKDLSDHDKKQIMIRAKGVLASNEE